MRPSVSIILPTYDRLPFLREAIHSVLAQTITDWELVVVDDGSTDETVRWLESLGERRISVVRTPHTGNPSALRNLGVARSSADWIAFLDSDDRWHPEKLERQTALHGSSPRFLWSYTGLRRIDASGAGLPVTQSKPWKAHSGWILPHVVALDAHIALPSVMVARAFLRSAGGFDEAFVSAEDYELWVRLAERGECGVVDEPLLDVRTRRDQSTERPDQCLGFVRIFRSLADRTTDPAIRARARTMQAYKAVDAVGMLAMHRRWSDAWGALATAIRVRPFGPFVYKAALRLLGRRLVSAGRGVM